MFVLAILSPTLLSGRVLLQSVLAYLDPGTGSYLIQLLIAGLLGLLFVVRLYWSKISQFFRKLFKKEVPTQSGDDPQKPA